MLALELGVRIRVRVTDMGGVTYDQGTKRLGTKRLGTECLEAEQPTVTVR